MFIQIPHLLRFRASCWALLGFLLFVMSGFSTNVKADELLDRRVRQFLDEHVRTWRDMNVPRQDGEILHDIIVERGFTRAFEIGTSTGHSTIWIQISMRRMVVYRSELRLAA